MENITNEKYARCQECGYIFDKSAKSCPNCGTPNQKALFERMTINESSEPVFNLLD